LIGMAQIWGIDSEAPELLEAAQELGADVAFFLKGGCAYYTGKGEVFDHALEPMKKSAVLIKPEQGVSTHASYAAFDKNPVSLDPEVQAQAFSAQRAEDVPLRNNLEAASQSLLPELVDIAAWIEGQAGVEASLLSGSGSAAFALCETFNDACRIVSAARICGWWARTTTLCSLGASIAPR
ncbi:MAG: 4-(cytidine 5'-diphospho)-2-C-methyl-D-erythritol kinase, partial [Raoultibacter sp.]